jgi:hypothetical protein
LARRRVLGGFAAGAMALLGFRAADAASCRAAGITCTANSQCCAGLCGPKDARGRRTCACGGDLTADPLNCGACGVVCPAPQNGQASCGNSICSVVCNPGHYLSGGLCPPKKSNGSTCAAHAECAGGACVARSAALQSGTCTTAYFDGCGEWGNLLGIDGEKITSCFDGTTNIELNCGGTPCPDDHPLCLGNGIFCWSVPAS